MGSVSTVSASVHSRLMTNALSDHRPCYGRQQIQPPGTLGMAVSVVTIALQPRHRQGDLIHLSERSEGFPPGLGFLRNIPFWGLCCSETLKENTPSVSVFSRTASLCGTAGSLRSGSLCVLQTHTWWEYLNEDSRNCCGIFDSTMTPGDCAHKINLESGGQASD